ncbi:MAG: restriction endonuclease subunit S [Balneolales bacterium]|nr:restriction endonuclease subunit S [Balneolales bacterium]
MGKKNNIPETWIDVVLTDVAYIEDHLRKPINSAERQSRIEGKSISSLFPYYGATGQVGLIDSYLTDGDYVLIGEDGAPFFDPFRNKAYEIKGKTWVNNHAHILKANKFFSQKYLLHYLNQFDYKDYVSGTTRLKLTKGSLERFPLPLPPLNEQHRIVSKIEELFSELDNGVANLKLAQNQLKVYRQALLKYAFEGKLTEQWRKENNPEPAEKLLERIKEERQNRYQQELKDWKAAVKAWEKDGKIGRKPGKPKALKEPSPLSKSDLSSLPTLPETSFWLRVGDLTLRTEYGSSAKSQKTGKIPVLRMGNIQNWRFDWSDLVYTSNKEEIRQYLLKYNDVLFNRTNSPELVGKTAIYKGEQPAIFAGYLIRINQIETLCNADYLTYFLNSQTAKNHGQFVKTDGVNQSNINGEKLKNYPFPYSSLSEQNAIVEQLESQYSIIDNLEKTIESGLKKSEALRQSILKKAFQGKLVPQDPNDEPASELLKRIQAEKKKYLEEQKQQKKKKKSAKILNHA